MILETISLQFAIAPDQEMNQVEAIQLEADGAWDDEEDSRQQADENFVEEHG